MFIIQCSKCGEKVEWKKGSHVGRMAFEISGSVVRACDHRIFEVAGHNALREFNVSAEESDDK